MSLVVAALIVAVAVALSVAAMLLVRRRIRGDTLLTDQTRGSAVYGVVGTSYAVMLAFVTLIAFQTYNSAKEGAEREAVAVVELARTAAFYPPAQRDRLRGQLACYGRAVVHDEWPLLEDGERGQAVEAAVANLRAIYGELAATSEQQRAGIRQVLEQTEERGQGRRERLSVADPFVPGPVWVVLILGGLVTTAFPLLLVDRRESTLVQTALIGSVAVLIVSGLLLVRFLDHPYDVSSGGIEPREMERTLTILDQAYPAPAPCDARGRQR